jgi:hypothetical protein
MITVGAAGSEHAPSGATAAKNDNWSRRER